MDARRTVPLGTTAACGLLLLAAPSPADAWATAGGPATAGDPTAPLVALLSLLAWLLAGWLLLTVALTAGAHLPGAVGRLLAGVSRRVAPRVVRRTVEVALGLTVVVGTVGATPALAAPGPAAPAPAVSLDWAAAPADATSAPAHDLDWAASPPPVAAPVQAAPPPGPEVVVRPGDSLWALAERDLAARGEVSTDAAVAQAWPGWWAANRDAVGDDPDLLQPGTHLVPPPADGPPSQG